MKHAAVTKSHPESLSDEDHGLLDAVGSRFRDVTDAGRAPLFRTDADGLWPLFLRSIPEGLRQVYTCNACRHFTERFGGLVTIGPDGETNPAVWGDSAPPTFAPAISALAARVRKARVTGVFLSASPVLGTPKTGPWNHFSSCVVPFVHPLLRPHQAEAERREDRAVLARSLSEFPPAVVRNALHLVETGNSLYRSEKVAGPLRWLLELHEKLAATRGRRRENVVWLAAATAPPGFAHVRTTMVGTLLEDLAAGLEFEAVKARFAEKMHPLQYQRPAAGPSAGQIEQAEKAFAAMGLAPALRRRFARLDDVEALWRPAVEPGQEKPGGVFGHLRPRARGEAPVESDEATTMTWEKFRRVVLPTAKRIEVYAERGGWIALTTAADPEAPPILQWDRPERRNPVSWYVYIHGSSPEQFNVRTGWVDVSAVCMLPPQWGLEEPRPHWGEGVILIVEGAKDTRSGRAFFPEQLRSELYSVRKTIEAYADSAMVEGAEEASAAGVDLRKGGKWSCRVRVTSTAGRAVYKLDRWD